ncbi:hypothetical protein QF043_001609 [Pseudomonas sp. W3I7]|nr:hypothetical protein [Pseudomonas sp. W3I7]MDQ0702817.1 hypothetical protein [Pseudomonas sp. W3I7]
MPSREYRFRIDSIFHARPHNSPIVKPDATPIKTTIGSELANTRSVACS